MSLSTVLENGQEQLHSTSIQLVAIKEMKPLWPLSSRNWYWAENRTWVQIALLERPWGGRDRSKHNGLGPGNIPFRYFQNRSTFCHAQWVLNWKKTWFFSIHITYAYFYFLEGYQRYKTGWMQWVLLWWGWGGEGSKFHGESRKSCLPAWCHLESVPHLQEA